jgi:lysophosphatidylcholine acyltransferase/lyso-PAF acetyltransferase
MSFWLLIKIFFLVFYVGICAIITYIVYKEQNQYYTPLYVTKKPSKEGEKEIKINLHDEFEEYNKRDQPINLFRLFIGVLFFGAIKLFLNIICALIITYKATKRVKDKKINQEDIDFIRNTTEFFTKIFLKISGVFVNKKRLPDEKVLKIYQKYFGPDYKIDYDGKFSCYISNHSCIYDLIFGMAFYGCGFVAKQEIRDIPIFGKMASSLHTIFVNRNSTGSKNNTLDEIVERQKNFYEGKPVMPFMIYPEGTTTSGRHLLRFKKGAFSSLLPIKATILKPNLSDKYHLSCGSSDVGMNFVRSLAKLYVKAEYIELPIIAPNEYMYEHFGNFGKEKWEIFAEVTREIMCELGDFKKSQRGIRDNFRYCSCIEKKTLLDSKTYKIE